MTKRRSFSIEEKLALLQEVEEIGVTETCRRHDLSHSVINRWRKKFEAEGVEGLKVGYPRVDPQVSLGFVDLE
ncbi:MAG: transposase [Bacteroidales bacterium]|nr:transposase [Bacteroidales bacterium]